MNGKRVEGSKAFSRKGMQMAGERILLLPAWAGKGYRILLFGKNEPEGDHL